MTILSVIINITKLLIYEMSDQELIQWCKLGNLLKIKKVLDNEKKGKEKLRRYTSLNFLVRRASENGNLCIVRYLVEEHKVNIHDYREYCLRCASQRGYYNTVNYLLETCEAKIIDNDAIINACQNKYYKVATMLIAHGADPHFGLEVLHYDSKAKCNETTRKFLKKSQDNYDLKRMGKCVFNNPLRSIGPPLNPVLEEIFPKELEGIIFDYIFSN